MQIIADLQIHSKYSRATSKNLSFENLEKYARIKGLTILGCGDFQHPKQRQEIEEQLTEDKNGILWSKTKFPFLWQTEVSLMFSQGGKRRAVHLLIFAPNKIIADKIITYLGSKGRLDYDGRPIFGITCAQLTKDLKAIDDAIEIIPAHCMTPWFGLYGSDSGFDSLEECFLDQTRHVYAIESGMSADPPMLWRLKEKVNIVSFSDAHSFWPWRLGREATIFDIPELSYKEIQKALRTGIGFTSTIETPPEYGKYHYDGHRNCNVEFSPQETEKNNGICPVCKKPLTIGVENRIEKLAKESANYRPSNAKQFHRLIPLHELIAIAYDTKVESKKAMEVYDFLIKKHQTELNILMHVPKEKLITESTDPLLAELITEARENKLQLIPGYDGVYGKVMLPKGMMPQKKKSESKQAKLF